MATGSSPARSKGSTYRSIDAWMERIIGADFRLIYGMLVPILILCGLIIALAAEPKPWLVGILVLLEVCSLVVIVSALMTMMGDDEVDPARGASGSAAR
jgi:hypothetical protein